MIQAPYVYCALYYDYITYVVLLPQFLYAPIDKYDNIGKIIFYSDGKMYKELPIKASSDALSVKGKDKPEYSFWDKLFNIFTNKSKG